MKKKQRNSCANESPTKGTGKQSTSVSSMCKCIPYKRSKDSSTNNSICSALKLSISPTCLVKPKRKIIQGYPGIEISLNGERCSAKQHQMTSTDVVLSHSHLVQMKFLGVPKTVELKRLPPFSRQLDLNVASVPDLNEDLSRMDALLVEQSRPIMMLFLMKFRGSANLDPCQKRRP